MWFSGNEFPGIFILGLCNFYMWTCFPLTLLPFLEAKISFLVVKSKREREGVVGRLSGSVMVITAAHTKSPSLFNSHVFTHKVSVHTHLLFFSVQTQANISCPIIT